MAPPEGVHEERRRETFPVEILQQVTSLGRGGHQLVPTCCHPLLHHLRTGTGMDEAIQHLFSIIYFFPVAWYCVAMMQGYFYPNILVFLTERHQMCLI